LLDQNDDIGEDWSPICYGKYPLLIINEKTPKFRRHMLYLVVRLILRGRREAYGAVKWPCKAGFTYPK
jgi:hypothetical protein